MNAAGEGVFGHLHMQMMRGADVNGIHLRVLDHGLKISIGFDAVLRGEGVRLALVGVRAGHQVRVGCLTQGLCVNRGDPAAANDCAVHLKSSFV